MPIHWLLRNFIWVERSIHNTEPSKKAWSDVCEFWDSEPWPSEKQKGSNLDIFFKWGVGWGGSKSWKECVTGRERGMRFAVLACPDQGCTAASSMALNTFWQAPAVLFLHRSPDWVSLSGICSFRAEQSQFVVGTSWGSGNVGVLRVRNWTKVRNLRS